MWPDRDEVGYSAMEQLATHLRSLKCTISLANPTTGPEDGSDAADCTTAEITQILQSSEQQHILPPKGAANPIPLQVPHSITQPEQIIESFVERGSVSILGGAGGTGKSLRTILEFLAVAANRPDIIGHHVIPGKTLLLPLEEGHHIFLGRLRAAMNHYKVKSKNLNAMIFPESYSARISLKNLDDMQEWLTDTLIEHNIDLLIIDPMAYATQLELNSNAEAADLLFMLRHIAINAKCGIRLVHHTRKMDRQAQDSFSIEDLRGARAIIDLSRSADLMRTIYDSDSMEPVIWLNKTPQESKRNNMLTPKPSAWNIISNNGWPILTPKNIPPQPSNNELLQHLKNTPPEQRRSSPQAKHWIGHAIAKAMHIDIGPRGNKKRSQSQSNNRSKVINKLNDLIASNTLKQSTITINRKQTNILSPTENN